MNSIENTLKKLSMLYEFNRKLQTFTTSTKDNQANQDEEVRADESHDANGLGRRLPLPETRNRTRA
jgi:hypothetical protein